jgi:hypothetical protein
MPTAWIKIRFARVEWLALVGATLLSCASPLPTEQKAATASHLDENEDEAGPDRGDPDPGGGTGNRSTPADEPGASTDPDARDPGDGTSAPRDPTGDPPTPDSDDPRPVVPENPGQSPVQGDGFNYLCNGGTCSICVGSVCQNDRASDISVTQFGTMQIRCQGGICSRQR